MGLKLPFHVNKIIITNKGVHNSLIPPRQSIPHLQFDYFVVKYRISSQVTPLLGLWFKWRSAH